MKYGAPLPDVEPIASSADPDWKQANPAEISAALARAQARPHGNWYVVDASRRIEGNARKYRILGRDLIAWRTGSRRGEILMAPESCPHMGASLDGACVRDGDVICPWHGLPLGKDGYGAWKTLPVHDDGILTWVRIGAEDPAVPLPVLPERPAEFMDGVIRLEANCEPGDVVANRLDPWHGAHFHPYSFASLTLLDKDEDTVTVRVAKRIVGRIVVETDAVFHSPEPNSIVMTIIEGEGKGSVVETHAAPIDPGRSAIVEATLATSDRFGFHYALKLKRFVRPFIERTARKLWIDDAAYAERTYAVRKGLVK